MTPIIIPILFLLYCFISSQLYNSIKTKPKTGMILIHSLFVNKFKVINRLQDMVNPQNPIFAHKFSFNSILGFLYCNTHLSFLPLQYMKFHFSFSYTHILSLLSYNTLHECLKDVNVMGVELTLLHALYIICLLTIITFLFSEKIRLSFVSFLSFY